jgi:hypothetical protein
MRHLARIQAEFLKTARKWDDLTYDEQKAYLKRHPLSKRRITARPDSGRTVAPTLDMYKEYVKRATNYMWQGYVIAVPKDGKKQYYKLDKTGKLWTSQYENTNWVVDEEQELPQEIAQGAQVVGPTLQTFDTTKQPTRNTYFKTTEPIPAWILTGHSASNYYYGNSNILTPTYERRMLPTSTSIQILVGGDFAVVNGQRQPVKFTDPAADKSPFEKNYGYDPTKKRLPLKALQEVTAEGAIIKQPVKQEVEKPVQTTIPTVEDYNWQVRESLKTKPPKSMSKQEIAKLLSDSGIADSARYSDKKNGFVFKRGYFYAQGMDSDKFANAVMARARKVGLTPVLVDSSNHWHRWPKDSWFEAVVKFEQMKDSDSTKTQTPDPTPVEKDVQPSVKDFPAEDIIKSMTSLRFSTGGTSSSQSDDEPEVFKDRSGNVTDISRGFRELGHWHSRPGEEDDDHPNWDTESAKKYKKLFEDWVSRKEWFDPATMRAYVEPEEKRWVTFGVEKKR